MNIQDIIKSSLSLRKPDHTCIDWCLSQLAADDHEIMTVIKLMHEIQTGRRKTRRTVTTLSSARMILFRHLFQVLNHKKTHQLLNKLNIVNKSVYFMSSLLFTLTTNCFLARASPHRKMHLESEKNICFEK